MNWTWLAVIQNGWAATNLSPEAAIVAARSQGRDGNALVYQIGHKSLAQLAKVHVTQVGEVSYPKGGECELAYKGKLTTTREWVEAGEHEEHEVLTFRIELTDVSGEEA